jgi:hypothetical protein
VAQPTPAPALRRELGLRDVTLFAITCIVSTRWIAAAAHAGPGSITLWLLAAVFFVVPLAIAVAAGTAAVVASAWLVYQRNVPASARALL